MEVSGHPTQDLVEELVRRGAAAVPGAASGPDPDALAASSLSGEGGFWLYLPGRVYETEIDEGPPVLP